MTANLILAGVVTRTGRSAGEQLLCMRAVESMSGRNPSGLGHELKKFRLRQLLRRCASYV